MSLILDALRKSEAERRRGEMPDLRAELPPSVRTVAPRRRWPVWFAGIAAVIAIVALAWGVWNRAPAPLPADTAVEAKQEPPASAPTDVPPEPHLASTLASTTPAAPTRSTPIPGGEPPQAQPVEDDVYAGASAREPSPTAEAPATPAAPAPAPVSADDRYAPAIANAASASPTPAPAAITPAAPAANSPSPAAAPAPAAPLPMPPPAVGPAVRISDLSPGEREQLPALKISMHMFGPTPAQRFAIIDGARVTQGDRVGDAVVEEIASDGVVLNWHGRHVSLPLR